MKVNSSIFCALVALASSSAMGEEPNMTLPEQLRTAGRAAMVAGYANSRDNGIEAWGIPRGLSRALSPLRRVLS